MRHLLFCVAVVLLAGAVVPAAERWTRVEAPHFVVSGDASAESVREVAVLLEMFREVFLRLLPGARDRSLLPPFVVVFGSDRAFTPFKPMYEGRPAPVGGYAVHEPLAPCIALRLDPSRESYRTIFHEYAHVLFDAPRAPLWLTEGVADYYSTATVHRDRRRVLLGSRVPAHLRRMERTSWVPIDRVLAASRSSKIWNGEARESFYAESWALIHYLVRGTSARGAQIARFLERLARGEDESSAFAETIGSPVRVNVEVRRYVENGMAPPEEVALPAQVEIEPLRGRPMSDAEVEATLGRVLFQLGRDADALARLNAAIGLDSGLPEAHATIGLLRLRQGRAADAIGPLRHANARDPENPLVGYNFALVTLQAADAGLSAPLEEGFTALKRVIRRDGPAEPLAVLGTIAGRLGRLGEAEDLLRQAAQLAPGRFPTRIELADVCLRVGKFDEARLILAELASGAEGDQVPRIDQRRRWLSLAEERAAVRAELAAAAGLPSPGPDTRIAQSGRFPLPVALRTPGADETRAAGLLEAIDCPSAGVAARVTTRSGPLSLSVPADVYVASARRAMGVGLTCGDRELREAVYVTWKGQRLVAIEFLPEEYQPRGADGDRRYSALRLAIHRRTNVVATTAIVTGQ